MSRVALAMWGYPNRDVQGYRVVLGKFGLVRFEPFLAKPETKPFGFCQKFSNPNPNRYKPFESVWFGLNSV